LATKQFDLSVGYHLGMAQMLIIGLQVQQGLSWPVASAMILMLSVLVGFLNGALVTWLKIDSFIATMGAFVASGFISGIAGIVLGSILQTGTPSVGPEYLLPAFAATLLGATSIRPGRVNVIGTLLSVLVLAFSFSGVQQLGAPFFVQYFFNGGILIVAVGLSVYAARRRQRAATTPKNP
jgi:ribose transport system permease protein